jgi:hypothetical protein
MSRLIFELPYGRLGSIPGAPYSASSQETQARRNRLKWSSVTMKSVSSRMEKKISSGQIMEDPHWDIRARALTATDAADIVPPRSAPVATLAAMACQEAAPARTLA